MYVPSLSERRGLERRDAASPRPGLGANGAHRRGRPGEGGADTGAAAMSTFGALAANVDRAALRGRSAGRLRRDGRARRGAAAGVAGAAGRAGARSPPEQVDPNWPALD